MINRQVFLASRPNGVAQAEHFGIREAPVPALAAGEILVRNRYLSVEPAMRGWITDNLNYGSQVGIGEVMRSLAAGEVVASASDDYQPGDHVTGWFGWQDYAAVPVSAVVQRTCENELTQSLNVLGLNGRTALLALTLVGQPQPGETVVVSTAAGAVGSIVGQIARILGCRTVGITSSAEKLRDCVDLYGYDAAISYRDEDVGRRISELCPAGVDVYFDNTAGPISDAVLPHLAQRGRIVVCGTASFGTWDPWPRVERHLLVKRARMEGFVYFDHANRFDVATGQLRDWIAEGRLRWREDVIDGLDACPDALAGVYRGENRGKRLIRLA